MSYVNCAAEIAANIALDCSAPMTNGYTGRAVLINLSDSPTLTKSGTNPRIISAITLGSGVKVCVVDNTGETQPFNGSNVQSTDENGRTQYNKTYAVHIPVRGADNAKAIVEPLNKSSLGFLLVLEKVDRNGDGSFVVVGSQKGLKANADGIVRNEYENGGQVVATLSTVEDFFETVFFDTDYETTKTAFEALLAKAF